MAPKHTKPLSNTAKKTYSPYLVPILGLVTGPNLGVIGGPPLPMAKVFEGSSTQLHFSMSSSATPAAPHLPRTEPAVSPLFFFIVKSCAAITWQTPRGAASDQKAQPSVSRQVALHSLTRILEKTN